MENAKVVLIENEPFIFALAQEAIIESGHSIAGYALDYLAALLVVHETEADVYVVDANLTEGQNDGTEGEKLAAIIRSSHPEARIVSFSSNGQIPGSTDPFPKDEVIDLGSFITSL
ncbi:MAG TPA: hypothetical protein VLG13_03100 [Patescibacteria group bacterium]|nr:hypothetical protein [Patescibacteria group bacterium]